MSLKEMIEPVLNDNSKKVLEKRYLQKDYSGKIIETPKELFYRVSESIALGDLLYSNLDKKDIFKDVDKKEYADTFLLFYDPNNYDSDKNFLGFMRNLRNINQNNPKLLENTIKDFYNMMTNFEFLPNSPTLMNAGRELGQLSACFTLPIYDSMESIFQTLKDTAIIHKSGGGTGFSFSNLRPRNSVVKTTGGVASGPISFMKAYDAATEAVKQGGTRRGANMGILRIDHPDILDFIKCKENDKMINNFNISVAITDDFMNKLEKGEDYYLIDPKTKENLQKLNAKEVFSLITKQAHKNGEPGIVFIDRINKYNPTPAIGEIESTNPCGEQPLLPYESCNLGSINLGKFVENKKIVYNKLEQIIGKAVHFLDNVIDLNKYPLKEIEFMTKSNRKIGLGVMGFHDMLIEMGIPYSSEDALKIADEVMGFVNSKSKDVSERLANERGTFPNFDKSIYSTKRKMRNATTTTIAPTGTISIIANNVSSGIEPLFAVVQKRNVGNSLGAELTEINAKFEEIAKKEGFYSKEIIDEIFNEGTVRGNKKISEKYRALFETASEIPVEQHIKMQAAFQKNVDNAVSKTINMPNKATIEDVLKSYLLSYNLGCKGITIYRDGSRDEQLLVTGKKGLEAKVEKIKPKPRPEAMHGTTYKLNTGCGNLYVTINDDENGKPFELFTQMGKAGGCAASQLEALGRLVSLAFRSEIEPRVVIEQLNSIRCPSPTWGKGGKIFSCADAIAKSLNSHYKAGAIKNNEEADLAMKHSSEDEKEKNNIKSKKKNVVGVCPDCNDPLTQEEGCAKCHSCGYSKC